MSGAYVVMLGGATSFRLVGGGGGIGCHHPILSTSRWHFRRTISSPPPPPPHQHHHHNYYNINEIASFKVRVRVRATDSESSSFDDDDDEEDRNRRTEEAEGEERWREAEKLVDGMDFGELCNEFECISSPQVESTARQLARDILQLRQGNRALGTFALSVSYKDPTRSFTGRDKYKRPLWLTAALHNPSVTVQEMVMLSTSVLSIKWTIKGKPKSVIAAAMGIGEDDLIIKVNSQFTLNQISGQVIEHQELWDLSASSPIARAFFWASRRLFAAKEAAKDLSDSVNDLTTRLSTEKENLEIYPDPSGDPTKFFQRDDGFQRDAYQIALFLAVIYFVVQFLRTTL